MKGAGEGTQISVPDLPANPRVLSRLLSTLAEPGVSSSALARVILMDPALTLAVLRAVLAGTGYPNAPHGFDRSVQAGYDAATAALARDRDAGESNPGI